MEKEYYAQVLGEIDSAALQQLAAGVEISLGGGGRKYVTRPCRAYKLEEPPRLPPRTSPVPGLRKQSADGTELLLHTSWVSLTLTEGKYRQARLTHTAHPPFSPTHGPLLEPRAVPPARCDVMGAHQLLPTIRCAR